MDVLVATLIRDQARDEWMSGADDIERERDRDHERERERERDREREREREAERDRQRERESEKDRYKSSSSSNWDRSGSGSRSYESTPSGNEAQKKFGSAKAISSDQYFADSDANSVSFTSNLISSSSVLCAGIF